MKIKGEGGRAIEHDSYHDAKQAIKLNDITSNLMDTGVASIVASATKIPNSTETSTLTAVSTSHAIGSKFTHDGNTEFKKKKLSYGYNFVNAFIIVDKRSSYKNNDVSFDVNNSF